MFTRLTGMRIERLDHLNGWLINGRHLVTLSDLVGIGVLTSIGLVSGSALSFIITLVVLAR